MKKINITFCLSEDEVTLLLFINCSKTKTLDGYKFAGELPGLSKATSSLLDWGAISVYKGIIALTKLGKELINQL